MRICLDFRPALREGTGVGAYVRNLAAALVRTHPEDELTLFTASWRHRLGASERTEGASVSDWRLPVRAVDWCWHRLRWPAVEFFVGPQDIVHSPSPMLVPARRARQVITVHDCWFLRHPEEVFGPVRRDYVPLARRAAARADAVVVPSATTAAEVAELLGVPESRLRVTPLGVDPVFFSSADSGGDAASVASSPMPRPGFLLFVGRREARKDLGTLLAALDLLLAERTEVMLAIVGPDAPGWQMIWNRATARAREQTRLIPHQSPAALARLYRAAAALVVPSRWEGFGLPPLEAMAAGTPVVASRAGALPEVLGDAALWAPPGDAPALADRCRALLEDPALAARYRNLGRQRAAEFRWETTAERTHALYRELVEW